MPKDDFLQEDKKHQNFDLLRKLLGGETRKTMEWEQKSCFWWGVHLRSRSLVTSLPTKKAWFEPPKYYHTFVNASQAWYFKTLGLLFMMAEAAVSAAFTAVHPLHAKVKQGALRWLQKHERMDDLPMRKTGYTWTLVKHAVHGGANDSAS